MRDRIDVSAEMVALVGPGTTTRDGWPASPVVLSFRLSPATVALVEKTVSLPSLDDDDLTLIVASDACSRIFGPTLTQRSDRETSRWHLPTDIRAIALAILKPRQTGEARQTLRLAKSIELLCATFEHLADGSLVAADGSGDLSTADAQRIAEARRLIDERWHEKLTLEAIARACGLNRTKLTRGFRTAFAMTVADAIADRRLGGAQHMLLATDLPVSSIGYRCGYLNNASFTRAFSRRFGQAPTQFRAERTAA